MPRNRVLSWVSPRPPCSSLDTHPGSARTRHVRSSPSVPPGHRSRSRQVEVTARRTPSVRLHDRATPANWTPIHAPRRRHHSSARIPLVLACSRDVRAFCLIPANPRASPPRVRSRYVIRSGFTTAKSTRSAPAQPGPASGSAAMPAGVPAPKAEAKDIGVQSPVRTGNRVRVHCCRYRRDPRGRVDVCGSPRDVPALPSACIRIRRISHRHPADRVTRRASPDALRSGRSSRSGLART